jgi:hypothetical protein
VTTPLPPRLLDGGRVIDLTFEIRNWGKQMFFERYDPLKQ